MTDPANLFGGTPLAERIAKAKDHMAGYRQHNETLWPHQSFALTVGELLDAAERGIKAAAEVERLRALAAPSVPSGEPVATVGDLIIQARERVMAAGLLNRAPLYAAPQPAPAGWRLVPVEATPGMIHAVTRAESRHMLEDLKRGGMDPHLGWKAAYAAMLAAAPAAPGQEPQP